MLFEFGPFRLDVAERVVTKSQEVVPLTPKAFDILVALVRNSAHVVEKDELLKAVWPDTFVEEGVLAVNVAAIRKALSDGENAQSYIETVPRRGYWFIGDVQQAGKASEGGAAATEPTQQKSLLLPLGLERSSPQQGKSRSWMWSPRMRALAALISILGVTLTYWFGAIFAKGPSISTGHQRWSFKGEGSIGD
jgi:DNA-binding winged helix-turn-helix (wHTH) protein